MEKSDYSGVADSYVLVIVTGGTIAKRDIVGDQSGQKLSLETIVSESKVLNDSSYRARLPQGLEGFGNAFALPSLRNFEGRVIYFLIKLENLKYSNNIGLEDYKAMAGMIQKNYDSFNGFVILHGTDTMAYTASYLSFMLENLNKSVVLTGSQNPIFETRNDAISNFQGALIVAGTCAIPEVTIYFNNTLFRGNRARKIDVGSMAASKSPNFGPLIEFGDRIYKFRERVLPNSTSDTFQANLEIEKNVGIVRFYPGLSLQLLNVFLGPPMKGLVLLTYGNGHAPAEFVSVISKAVESGVSVINCTQCDAGAISENSHNDLHDAGVVNGLDITPEAALAKLAYVLGKKELSYSQKKALLEQNLRGEVTVDT